jgi:hypothetical protein
VTLDTILAATALVLAASALLAVWYGFALMRDVRRLVASLEERLPPLIEHAEDTLASVDREIERVDGIVSQVEEVSETVTSTTRVAGEVVRKPLVTLAGIGGGLRGVLSSRKRR